jgi:hypothetical protein
MNLPMDRTCSSRAGFSASFFPRNQVVLAMDRVPAPELNRRMEILGLSQSTPKTENRLKSLFWPSIQSGADVDYLGAQGYWVVSLLAALSLVFLFATRHPIVAVLTFAFYYLGAVGVRERNLYAAIVVFFMFVLDTIVGGIGVLRVLLGALLFSNIRATWICSAWDPASDEEAALPPRFGDTLGDKFADKLPAVLWPKLRIVFYIFSVVYIIAVVMGLAVVTAMHLKPR